MSRQHLRSDSGATGVASSHDYAAAQDGRRHDYDVQSMETSLSSPRGLLKNPIPAPTVTVRIATAAKLDMFGDSRGCGGEMARRP
jgi:hypothetical protein